MRYQSMRGLYFPPIRASVASPEIGGGGDQSPWGDRRPYLALNPLGVQAKSLRKLLVK